MRRLIDIIMKGPGFHIFSSISCVVICSRPSVGCLWERPPGLFDYPKVLKLATAITADVDAVVID